MRNVRLMMVLIVMLMMSASGGLSVWAQTLVPMNAPEISRSEGEEGGVVVFWPRIIPRTDSSTIDTVSAALQARLKELAQKALPSRPIDVRPKPERVCPQSGCKAMTVGVLVAHFKSESCVAIALVSGPGTSSTRLIPWVGKVRLKQLTVPFRAKPESQVSVTDFTACSDVMKEAGEKEADVIAAIKAMAPTH